MVAAKKAVKAPITVTITSAVVENSNIGDVRATMKTPAVTMVAAWMRALTGVGPSIASGSQVWSGTCADLPIAPMKSRTQIVVITSSSKPRKSSVLPCCSDEAAKTVSKSTEPKTMNMAMMPRAKPKSPIRLTRKALMAAALAEGRSYQKPISR